MQSQTVQQIIDFCLVSHPARDYRLLYCLTSVLKGCNGQANDEISSIDDVLLMLAMAKHEKYADGSDCVERIMVKHLAEAIDGILKLEIRVNWIIYSGCQDFVNQKYTLSKKEYPYTFCKNAKDLNIKFLIKNAENYGCDLITNEDGMITYFLKPYDTVKDLPETFVYCFREKESDNVKFGYSTNIDQRMDSIQAANGDKIICVGFLSGTLKQEQELHQSLRKVTKQSEGGSEWYKLSNSVVKNIYKMFLHSEHYTIEEVLSKATGNCEPLKAMQEAIEFYS